MNTQHMLTTITILTLLTVQACDLTLPNTKITDWPLRSSSVTTTAPPLNWFVRAFTCAGTKRQMKNRMAHSKISIGRCISTIQRKCSTSNPFVYEPCLQEACFGNDRHNQMKELAHEENRNENTLISTNTVNVFSQEKWTLYVSLISLGLCLMAAAWKIKKVLFLCKNSKVNDEELPKYKQNNSFPIAIAEKP